MNKILLTWTTNEESLWRVGRFFIWSRTMFSAVTLSVWSFQGFNIIYNRLVQSTAYSWQFKRKPWITIKKSEAILHQKLWTFPDDISLFAIRKSRFYFLRELSKGVVTSLDGINGWSTLFFFSIRILFFRPRMNILIFLSILGWIYTHCILVLFLNCGTWHFRFVMYWGINYFKCSVSRTVSHYILHMLHRSARSRCHVRHHLVVLALKKHFSQKKHIIKFIVLY